MRRKRRDDMSVFDRNRFPRTRNPLKGMYNAGLKIKWAWQRATRGYAECDTWDIYSWFLGVMPDMLEDMADTLNGYPVVNFSAPDDPTDICIDDDGIDKWRAILREMAQHLRDADETVSSRTNRYEAEYEKALEEFQARYGTFGEQMEKTDGQNGNIKMHFPSECPQWKDIAQKYLEEEKNLAEFRDESMKKGMKMFTQWFWHL